jgi:hypothetical protein
MFAFDPSGNAKGRLLPPDVPFRFFAAAIVSNVLAWLAFLVFCEEALQGLSLAATGALHLATLGVLATTAVGASFQLLPVATKRPVRSVALCKLTFWLLVPGTALFAAGLVSGIPRLAEAGGGLAALGLLLYLGLLIDNLRAVADLPQVTRHAWVAVASLGLLVLLGVTLAANLAHGFLGERTGIALAHGILAAYGFMGMMVMGLSYILIPMFALAPAPSPAQALLSARLGGAAVMLAALGALADLRALLALAALLGLGAFAVYLRAMKSVISQRMRRQMGFFFKPIFAGWFFIAVSLLIGLLLALGALPPAMGPLFAFALVAGGLVTFLLGVLQRIMPFLASMHCAGPNGRTPTLSQLADERLVKAHFWIHLAALILVFAGLAHGWIWPLKIGSALGLLGALVFAAFALDLWRRARNHKRSA